MVLEKEAFVTLMQSFGLFLRKCEEANTAGQATASISEGETMPRLPGFMRPRRVLNYSSMDRSNDDGIFFSQRPLSSGSENSIPYATENEQGEGVNSDEDMFIELTNASSKETIEMEAEELYLA